MNTETNVETNAEMNMYDELIMNGGFVDEIVSDAGKNMLEGAVVHGRCVPPRTLQCFGDSPIATLQEHARLTERGARLLPDCFGSVPTCICTGCKQDATYILQNKGDKMNSLAVCHDCFFKGAAEGTAGTGDDIFSTASEECQRLSTEILGRALNADMILQNNLRGSGHIFSGFAVLPDDVKGVQSVSNVSLSIRRVGSHEVTRVPIHRKKYLCEDNKLFLTAYYDINDGGKSFEEGRSIEPVRDAASAVMKKRGKKFSLKETYAYLFSTLPILGQTVIEKTENGVQKKVAQSNFVNKGIHKSHMVIQHDARGRLVQRQVFFIQIECTMRSDDEKLHRVVFAASEDDKTQITTTTRRLIRRQTQPKAGKKRPAEAIEIDHTASPVPCGEKGTTGAIEIDYTASPVPCCKKQRVTPPPMALTKSTVQECDQTEIVFLRRENKHLMKMVSELHEKTSNFQRQNATLLEKMEAKSRIVKQLSDIVANRNANAFGNAMDMV